MLFCITKSFTEANTTVDENNIKLEDVVCKDPYYKCHDNQTCCQMPDGEGYGCCPIPEAVCCIDGKYSEQNI